MGFVIYTILFLISWGILALLVLITSPIPVISFVFCILIVLLIFIYVCYISYKILISDYCWLLLSPLILIGFLCGIVPGILMIIIIYICRNMTLEGKRELERQINNKE